MKKMDLRTLLNICVDQTNKMYGNAWREFDRRYRSIILGRILTITKNREDINDISQMVMQRLIINDFRALKNFRAKHSEVSFRAWLNVISRLTALAYISKKKDVVSIDELEDFATTWESYQVDKIHRALVASLRGALKQTQKHESTIERDVFIFSLRRVGSFKAKEVAKISSFNTTPGNVDNVVNRLQNSVKKMNLGAN